MTLVEMFPSSHPLPPFGPSNFPRVAWQAKAGTYGPYGAASKDCPAGSYCPAQSTVARACPANKLSPASSSDVAACKVPLAPIPAPPSPRPHPNLLASGL